MNEIIHVKNDSYNRYEELLMRRDAFRKEAFIYERAYIGEFGDLILEIFRVKIECIRKKKTIEFCQAAANHGKSVDQNQLQEYLKQELAAFQEQLNAMIEDANAAQNSGSVTEAELLQIKKIYHEIVKQIHPDINPMVGKSEELKILWQRAVVAYNCNNLKELQETKILVNKVLEQLGNETIDVEIPDIDEKIKELETEITEIRETDPYQYKFLLDDAEAVQEKKDSLIEEKRSYEEYSNQLDEILNGLLESGVSFIWHMN